MKKIVCMLILFLSISFVKSIYSTTRQDIQNAFLEKHSHSRFLDLDTILANPRQKIAQDNNMYLYLTKSDIDNKQNQLIKFLKTNKHTPILLEVTQESDDFVDQHGTLNLKSNNFFNIIQKLTIANKDGSVLSIGDSFLSGCENLTTLDLSAFSNIKHIGIGFLFNCQNLTSLKLSLLSNVTKIGNYFLYGCKNLTRFDLSSLSNVTYIENDFLYGCQSLTRLDLSPLSNVIHIGNDFLANCQKLTMLDLSPLSNVRHIGNDFLDNCQNLSTLDLSSFSNTTHIGNSFLSKCVRLTALDLSALSNVTHIGDDFLYGCLMIYTILLPKDPDALLYQMQIKDIPIQDFVKQHQEESRNQWIQIFSDFVQDHH